MKHFHFIHLLQGPSPSLRSGDVGIDNGRLRYSGSNGYGWSSHTHSSDVRYAYLLDFNASGVYPSRYDNRWYALPLRCLARQ